LALRSDGEPTAASEPLETTTMLEQSTSTQASERAAQAVRLLARSLTHDHAGVASSAWGTVAEAAHAPASSIKCVVSSVARDPLDASTKSHTARRDSGSMPAVGSSSSTNLGSPSNAMTSETLRRELGRTRVALELHLEPIEPHRHLLVRAGDVDAFDTRVQLRAHGTRTPRQ
jgi:hypothetical protein